MLGYGTRRLPIVLPPTGPDLWLARRIAQRASSPVERVAKAATWGADENLLMVAVGLAWIGIRLAGADAETRARADHLALVTAASAALPHLMKRVVDQERPDRVMMTWPRHGVPFSGRAFDSFPSGHAVHLGAIGAALSRWLPARWQGLLWPVLGGLAATRLVLLAHWASDVAAGFLVGLGLEAALHRLSSRAGRSGPRVRSG